jgi:hypothetical protein
LELWKKAAAVHQQQQQPAAAADLLAPATVRLYETAGAAEAHVSAILLAARAAADDPTQLDKYLALRPVESARTDDCRGIAHGGLSHGHVGQMASGLSHQRVAGRARV